MEERMMEMPESTEHVDESGNVFVTNYYGEAVGQMLDAPTLVYTDAHWAIEKALEFATATSGKTNSSLLDNATEILNFMRENRDEPEEAEVLYNMNSEPVVTPENPQRRSWR